MTTNHDALREALEAAQKWIAATPHGDNCFVSDHYEGDPGSRCNCGKESMESFLECALSQPMPEAAAQGCAGCGKTSTSDSMWALYCVDCTQKHGIGAMQWIELVHELCPEGIEDLCDECGGEDAKCPAGCTYRKARAMLSASPAAPAAPAAAQVAQPLTKEQIEQMLNENFGYRDMHTFARAIEAAHGIGKDQ